jgi:MOSC domain-containing protein YiiM
MGAPLVPRDDLVLRAGQGVEGDHGFGGKRHLTLLFLEGWEAACADLGRAVDPGGRRANVLLTGGGALALLGRRMRLGEAEIEIVGETRPCQVMERAAPGLEAALAPGGRAGVWARVLSGGCVRPGDRLEASV